jgi:hypothetical protein
MRRRQFLAAATAASLPFVAGCIHPSVVLDLKEASADDVADEVSTTVDAGSTEYAVVEEAVANGSTTHSDRSRLFDPEETVRFEDAFYDVSASRVGSSEVTVYDVLIDFDPEDATPERGDIEFEDLPPVDQERLERVVSAEPPEGEGSDIGVSYGTAEEIDGESVFVPDQEYDVLVHDGDRYGVAVESEPATETEFRYEVEQVAPDVEAFADQVRAQYLFVLSGLSDAEREVVENAIDGAHFEETDAFESVADRIRDHEGIRVADFYGTWLLEYEGVEYLAYVEW